MMYRFIGFFCLLFSVFGFANAGIGEFPSQSISQHICLTHGIIAQSAQIIKFEAGEKIYLHDEVVEKNVDQDFGGFIHIDSENRIYLPLLLSDQLGYYTSTSPSFLGKIFHQRCNKCDYEWQAKWYEMRCPNCGSTDFSNVLTRPD